MSRIVLGGAISEWLDSMRVGTGGGLILVGRRSLPPATRAAGSGCSLVVIVVLTGPLWRHPTKLSPHPNRCITENDVKHRSTSAGPPESGFHFRMTRIVLGDALSQWLGYTDAMDQALADKALPLRFPDAADQLFCEAQRLQGRPSTERFLAILDLIASGHRLLKDSPRRDQAQELRARDEHAWRMAHRNLFAKHGF